MPLVMWVLVFVSAGLLTGYSVPWQVALAACGAVAWLAAADLIEAPCMLFFAAACAIALADGRNPGARGLAGRPDSAALGERVRLHASAAIDSAFGADAPIVRALLVADQSEIPRDVKRIYADAGIVHMLAISGLHVSIVATSLMLLLSLARVPSRHASFATAAIILVYVFVLGFPAPALRAAVMVCVAAAARAYQRHASRWSVLALGGLAPLVSPGTVTEVGYQLSMAGMAGVIAAGALVNRVLPSRKSGVQRVILQSLLVSTVATLVTAPLVAAWFGRLSLIGPFTNLAADPVIAIVQPMLFLALVLSPWPAAARFVAAAAHPLLVAFEAIARAAASVPYAAVGVAVSPFGVILSTTAAIALVVACVSRLPGRAMIIAAMSAAGAVWLA